VWTTLIFVPALVSLCTALWRGRAFARWCFGAAVVAFLAILISAYALPTTTAPGLRAGLAGISMMIGAGTVGPALFISKPPAIVASLFAALLLAFPTMYVAYYALMSIVCANSQYQCY
jgi:hypothetical protein